MEKIAVEQVCWCENKLTFALMHYMLPNNFTREVDWCPGSSCESDISHFCGVTLTSDHLLSSLCWECKCKVVHFAKCFRVASCPTATNVCQQTFLQISLLDAHVEASGLHVLQRFRHSYEMLPLPLLLCSFQELWHFKRNQRFFFPQHALNEDKLHFKTIKGGIFMDDTTFITESESNSVYQGDIQLNHNTRQI